LVLGFAELGKLPFTHPDHMLGTCFSVFLVFPGLLAELAFQIQVLTLGDQLCEGLSPFIPDMEIDKGRDLLLVPSLVNVGFIVAERARNNRGCLSGCNGVQELPPGCQ
jgi:hypothetical protein